jgi:hypothetical protein
VSRRRARVQLTTSSAATITIIVVAALSLVAMLAYVLGIGSDRQPIRHRASQASIARGVQLVAAGQLSCRRPGRPKA